MAEPILIDASMLLYFTEEVTTPEKRFSNFSINGMTKDVREVPSGKAFDNLGVIRLTNETRELEIGISRTQAAIILSGSGRVAFDESKQSVFIDGIEKAFEYLTAQDVRFKRLGFMFQYAIETTHPEADIRKSLFKKEFLDLFSPIEREVGDAESRYMVFEKYESLNNLKVSNAFRANPIQAEIEGEPKPIQAISVLRDFSTSPFDDNSGIFRNFTPVKEFVSASISRLKAKEIAEYLLYGNQ